VKTVKNKRADLAIGMVIAVFLLGVLAASITRVSLIGPKEATAAPEKAQAGDAALVSEGKRLFTANCGGCHAADKPKGKYGPGFKGLSKAGKLPTSGRKATKANIRTQLKTPFKSMPAFEKLTEQEIRALAAYLLQL
jgi:mono/diheme cytochrome c family protein